MNENLPAGAVESIERILSLNARLGKLYAEWYIVCLALGNLIGVGSSINVLNGCKRSEDEKTSSLHDLSAIDGLTYLNESDLELRANM